MQSARAECRDVAAHQSSQSDIAHIGINVRFQQMHDSVAALAHIFDYKGCAPYRDRTGIGDLTTHFYIERRGFEDNLIALGIEDLGRCLRCVITCEGRCCVDLFHHRFLGMRLACSTGAGTLFVEQAFEFSEINIKSSLAGDELCEVDREAKGIVEFEGIGTGDHVVRCGNRVESCKPPIKSSKEGLFFGFDDAFDEGALFDDLGEDVAHGGTQDADVFPQHGLGEAEVAGVTGSATEDATQHIAPSLISGDGSVGDGEG